MRSFNCVYISLLANRFIASESKKKIEVLVRRYVRVYRGYHICLDRNCFRKVLNPVLLFPGASDLVGDNAVPQSCWRHMDAILP